METAFTQLTNLGPKDADGYQIVIRGFPGGRGDLWLRPPDGRPERFLGEYLRKEWVKVLRQYTKRQIFNHGTSGESIGVASILLDEGKFEWLHLCLELAKGEERWMRIRRKDARKEKRGRFGGYESQYFVPLSSMKDFAP